MRPSEWAEYEHRLAIIDLGTNSVRFDVYAVNEKGHPERLHREKRMVRLGEGLFRNGRLEPKAEARVHAALHDFSRMMRQWGVDSLTAYATSALREAKPPQRAQFLREIQKRHGIRLRVISGRREAALIARGILENEKLPSGRFALIDIGGGSTELTLCRGKKALSSRSFRLGALRLKQLYLSQQPPRSLGLLALRAGIDEALPRALGRAGTVIGSSGTIRALGRMASKAGRRFDPGFLRELNLKMAGLDRAGLMRLPGMEEKRVDLILAGSLLFEELVRRLGAKRLASTDYALRDGALAEALDKLKLKRR
jgi:exopolyphosphatase/guanosine-5'-triphosphate,3'-diphosphate pyrophosphatase